MRIGITYNLKNDAPPSSAAKLCEDASEEWDCPETIHAIKDVLVSEGHEVFLLGGDLGVIDKIRENRVEFVFNITEGYSGRNREAHIPALLELLGIPYSGSDPLGLAITLDKSLTKRIAISLGIPTPDFWMINEISETNNIPDRFPLFAKPLWEGSSKGIRRSSLVESRLALKRETGRLLKHYPDVPVLVEEYIPGKELTAGVLGNNPPEVLGVMEIRFRDRARKDFCYSLEVKRNWKEEVEYLYPAPIDKLTEKNISESVLRLFNALRLRDLARFDFRLSPEGRFYFLEVNPLPGLSPESGDLVILSQRKGWSYDELIRKITQTALSRYANLREHQSKPKNISV
ncbi:MAG: D-alanine--D-alanine ligase [Candidatus Omnitrophica bacterium]|nr:D-alanine--D-alanine ligase [Candidatus Omnitrophota bacterium]